MQYVIYVDESGTHSNRYMVICALITSTPESRKRIKNLIRRGLVKHCGPSVDELHASQLDIAVKQDICFKIASKNDHHVAYIVADKNHLTGEIKARPNLCYNYLFNVLFKKLVNAFPGDDFKIISDNRTVSAGSKNSLPEYIKTQAYAEWGYKGSLEIDFCDSRDVKGLQAVDLIANAVYAHYNLQKSHIYNIHTGHVAHRIQFPYSRFGT